MLEMDKWHRANFEDTIRIIYYCSRAFGLLPFSVIRDSNGRVSGHRINYFDLFWYIVSSCLYLASGYAVYRNIQFPQSLTSSIILIFGDKMLVIVTLSSGAVLIGMDMFNRQKLITILRRFTIFDHKVRVEQYENINIWE